MSNWFPYSTQCSSQQVPSSLPITHFPLSLTPHLLLVSKKKESKKINCQMQMMKPGRITISRTLSVQILSDTFTIKGLLYKAHVSLLLQARAAFKIFPDLGPSTNRADAKECSLKKRESCRISPGMRGPLGIKMKITKQVESFSLSLSFISLSLFLFHLRERKRVRVSTHLEERSRGKERENLKAPCSVQNRPGARSHAPGVMT